MMSSERKLAGRTIFITGASRGIGKAIALKAAKDGANVVIAAKTAEPHPKLPGTIYTAAKEIEAAGGKCLPCIVDVRDESQIQAAVEAAVKTFGGIDILVNNASAISLTGTLETPMKKYDLMHHVNTRGTYLTSKLCLPYLKVGKNPHILNLSPPLNMNPVWFQNHVAYTMAKYGMSMCVLGMAEEFRSDGVAVNALWPRTGITTAAMDMLGKLMGGEDTVNQLRFPEIMADAAYVILTRDSKNFTRNFCIDEDILREVGVKDFDVYAVKPGTPLMPDFFLDEFLEDFSKKSSPKKSAEATQDVPAGGAGQVDQVFKTIMAAANEEIVKKTNAVFAFQVKGAEEGQWYLDLKNGSGSSGKGESPSPPDATLIMDSQDFVKMFQGKLKATAAFMTGKLKIKGDMGKAMKLEKLMGSMQSKL
ncbi:hydroxysteroid dehydrogenase-like protein 2 isoform X1 [Daphnia pulex]|uniref:hydroxysteroid dehydrogenase-like protein 2 isoform X1 n=1 Tax=Daphnia pulex TaxID=6669 RepID=UPI001EDF6CCD|nr:hydroxysteroid dehydrogenase-like protein 2 isoform X1 [Daphnia pulex]